MGCLSYNRKGPCHCWTPETAKERKIANIEIEKLNEKLEQIMKEQWELILSNRMKRLFFFFLVYLKVLCSPRDYEDLFRGN